MKTTQEIFAADDKNYLPVFNRYKIALDRGDGVYVFDTEGKRYIDFLAGIAVNVLGHNYPPLVDAICSQAKKIIHCSNLYYTEAQATAAEKLVKLSGLERVFFANSGAEANEGALKIASKYAHLIDKDKSEIISAWDSFHGRTLATLTATGQPHYQEGLQPLPGGFSYVRFNDADELAAKINDRTAAVFLETIQGEGGVYPPQNDYLQKVRKLCDEHGALLILDEIQAGIGRSGKFFAYENYGHRDIGQRIGRRRANRRIHNDRKSRQGLCPRRPWHNLRRQSVGLCGGQHCFGHGAAREVFAKRNPHGSVLQRTSV